MNKFLEVWKQTFEGGGNGIVSALFEVPGILAIIIGLVCFICLMFALFKRR